MTLKTRIFISSSLIILFTLLAFSLFLYKTQKDTLIWEVGDRLQHIARFSFWNDYPGHRLSAEQWQQVQNS